MSEGRQPDTSLPGLDILLEIEEPGWAELFEADPETSVRRALEAAALGAGLPADIETEIGVTLTDDEAVRALNAQWREKDRPTNVLSFPMRPIQPGERPGPLMGDLVLALQTCRREAADEGKTGVDHATHLLVHGFLHLLGHDHLDDASATRMERLETSILSGLSIDDPYRAAGEEHAALQQDA